MRISKVLGQDRNDGFLRAMESRDDPARANRPGAEELVHAAHLAPACCVARWWPPRQGDAFGDAAAGPGGMGDAE